MSQLLQQNRPGIFQLKIQQLNPEFAISQISLYVRDEKSEKVLNALTQSKIEPTFKQPNVFVRLNESDHQSNIIVPSEGTAFATLDVYLSFLAHLLDKSEERESLAIRIFRDDFRPLICMSSACLLMEDDHRKQNLHVLFGCDASGEHVKFKIRLIQPPIPKVSQGWYRPLERVVI